ncbi:Protein unc-112 [Hypsibius exemplaris]|uniref:Protein unc-112 n=1 Tax=Hypsibius exemplaris TaxID=2072580 RepID=A0A1W0X9L5_HYPEX|nr:Protein unc-112 [Hypsibius exemplaris]
MEGANIYAINIPDARLTAKGAWDLSVHITDLEILKTITVTGDMNIGGVMLRLVSDLAMTRDWSDHELWWPEENKWLNRSRSTLDQYGVTAAAKICFTPKHKIIRVQLPDLQYITVSVDMSSTVFKAVCDLCKSLGIRHGEELSFCRHLPNQALKKNTVISPDLPPAVRLQDTLPRGGGAGLQQSRSMNSLDRRSLGTPTPPANGVSYHTPSPHGTLSRNSHNTLSSSSGGEKWHPFYAQNPYTTPLYAAPEKGTVNIVDGNGQHEDVLDVDLARSPQTPSREATDTLLRPRTRLEKARQNAAWLDSSRSLYEQGIREGDTVLLRFKFFTFYDLNAKFDVKRINQIYEQARWMLLAEELDCTEEEMMLFAALQYQVQLQSQVPQAVSQAPEDDIDAALNDLQTTLEGVNSPTFYNDIMQVPVLSDYLQFLKPKKFTLRGFRPYFVVLRDTTLSLFKDEHDTQSEPSLEVNLRGCEVAPDVVLTNAKYGIKLQVPMADGMQEMWLRCVSDAQYAKWMAAFKLASKGKTMADSSYQAEVQNLLSHLALQHTSHRQDIDPVALNVDLDQYVAPRFTKKNRNHKLSGRVMDAHSNVRNLTATEAKLQLINACQRLPDYAKHYFVVQFAGSRKEELLAVTPNQLIRLDINGRMLKTWPYKRMRDWHVNWYKKLVVVEFDDEVVEFWPVGADAKNVHEFIGGYIFLATRAEDKNQTLDEAEFHKLTGGWKA